MSGAMPSHQCAGIASRLSNSVRKLWAKHVEQPFLSANAASLVGVRVADHRLPTQARHIASIALRLMIGCMSSVATALDDATLARLRSIVDQQGLLGAARTVGVDRTVIARALAGLGLRRGSALLLRLNLEAAQAREVTP